MILDVVLVCTLSGLKEENTGVGMRWYLSNTSISTVRERLRKIWQMGFREGRNVGGPSRSDTGRHDPSNKTRPDKGEVSSRDTQKTMADGLHKRLKNMWQVGFREDRNSVGGPRRSDTGRHAPSSKTPLDKTEDSSGET